MNTNQPISLEDKKAYIQALGKALVRDYGKKKYYKPKEVKEAHQNHLDHLWPLLDFVSMGMSLFSSHEDFDAYQEQTGQPYDYADMKGQLLEEISTSDVYTGGEISDTDLDTSWLDFGDSFGGIFEGIGEFFGAIFEGISDL